MEGLAGSFFPIHYCGGVLAGGLGDVPVGVYIGAIPHGWEDTDVLAAACATARTAMGGRDADALMCFRAPDGPDGEFDIYYMSGRNADLEHDEAVQARAALVSDLHGEIIGGLQSTCATVTVRVRCSGAAFEAEVVDTSLHDRALLSRMLSKPQV